MSTAADDKKARKRKAARDQLMRWTEVHTPRGKSHKPPSVPLDMSRAFLQYGSEGIPAALHRMAGSPRRLYRPISAAEYPAMTTAEIESSEAVAEACLKLTAEVLRGCPGARSEHGQRWDEVSAFAHRARLYLRAAMGWSTTISPVELVAATGCTRNTPANNARRLGWVNLGNGNRPRYWLSDAGAALPVPAGWEPDTTPETAAAEGYVSYLARFARFGVDGRRVIQEATPEQLDHVLGALADGEVPDAVNPGEIHGVSHPF